MDAEWGIRRCINKFRELVENGVDVQKDAGFGARSAEGRGDRPFGETS